MIPTKQLLIEVEDSGPKTGPAILLLHGWPDDASAWDEVAPVLVATEPITHFSLS
jgi:pimeloyl-ACP methyl ester carboxylesterase